MRKLLALFGAVGLVSMSAATVVSCNDVADFGYYADSIQNNLMTETYIEVTDGSAAGTSFDMTNYFNEAGRFFYNGDNPLDKDGKPLEVLEIAYDQFIGALQSAISSIVSGSVNETDYTFWIKSAEAKDTTVDAATLNYKTDIDVNHKDNLKVQDAALDIHIEATKDSALWSGSSDIYIFTSRTGGEQ
jgi:hypothetical protein